MEDVDGRPEQVLQIVLKTGVAECRDEGIEDIGDCADDDPSVGEWSWIRFILEGVVAVSWNSVRA